MTHKKKDSEKQKDTCVKDLEMLAEMYIGENIWR